MKLEYKNTLLTKWLSQKLWQQINKINHFQLVRLKKDGMLLKFEGRQQLLNKSTITLLFMSDVTW